MINEQKSKEMDSHECCRRKKHDADGSGSVQTGNVGVVSLSRIRSYAGGIAAAIIACICCCLPVILVALGVATANNLVWFESYHLYVTVAGWLVMLAAVFYMWHQHRSAEVPILKDKHFWTPLVCMLIVYFSVTYVLENVVATRLPQTHEFHNHHQQQP